MSASLKTGRVNAPGLSSIALTFLATVIAAFDSITSGQDATGAAGGTGSGGTTGSAGRTGSAGATGSADTSGSAGTTGSTGTMGSAGTTGSRGEVPINFVDRRVGQSKMSGTIFFEALTLVWSLRARIPPRRG